MARSTYESIASIFAKDHAKFSVQMPIEPGGGITVYPPATYFTDHGVDVLIDNGTIDFRYDGEWIRTIHGDPHSDDVVGSIIDAIEAMEINYIKENEI